MDLPSNMWFWPGWENEVYRVEPVPRRWFEFWKRGRTETATYQRTERDGGVFITRNGALVWCCTPYSPTERT